MHGELRARTASHPAIPAVLVMVALLAHAGPAAAQGGRALDSRARGEAVRLLEARRTPAHRRHFVLGVPARTSDLPDRYEVLHHANFIASVPSHRVTRIVRTPSGAAGELLDRGGVHRASVPIAELDAFARLAFYLSHATQTQRTSGRGFGSGSYASHVPSQTVVIRDSNAVIAETPDHMQAIHEDLDVYDDVSRVGATLIIERLEELVSSHLAGHREPMSTALRSELVQRLDAIGLGPASLEDYRRDDRDAVEARLLGYIISIDSDARPLPLLLRAGLEEQAYALWLRTTPEDNLRALLPRLVCAPEWRVFSPALDRAAVLDPASARDVTRRALGCRHHESEIADLIRKLQRPRLEPTDVALLLDFSQTHESPLVRVAAARALAEAGPALHRSQAIEALFAAAEPPAEERMPGSQTTALEGLAVLAAREPGLRSRLSALVGRLFARVTLDTHATFGGVSLFVHMASALDPAAHSATLERLLAHPDSSLAVDVIEAIGAYDPDRALREARSRIRLYADGDERSSGYGWEVGSYVDRLLAADDREAVPILRAAGTRLAHDEDERDDNAGAHRALLRYLTGTSGPARVEALVELVRARGDLSAEARAALVLRHASDGLTEAALDAALDAARR